DETFETLLDLAEIADHHVEFDVLDIPQGIDVALGVRDGRVVKGTYHVRERVHLAKVGEEVGFLEGFLANGGDVHILNGRVGGLLRGVERGEFVETLVGNGGDAEVCFARAAVSGSDVNLGKDFEQRCFAYLRQADDSTFHELALSN